MPKTTLLYIPTSSKREASKIAKHLLAKRLVACANVFPITSLYLWKGKIVNEKEVVLLLKTFAKNFTKVKKEVEKIHSYKTPAILKIPAEANEKYVKWLKNEIA